MKTVVLSYSGGLDSTTLLAHYLANGYSVIACSFTYGSKHNVYELEASKAVIDYYQRLEKPVVRKEFRVDNIFKDFSSNLLLGGGEIPEGHYESENMKLTVVPGRNLIFASILAGLAESMGVKTIALGVHQGDHHIYPDCRKDFVDSLSSTIYLSSDGKVRVEAPFLSLTKAQIVAYGTRLEAPYQLTRTCYKDQPLACGRCGSCRERIEAFALNDLVDPITYE